MTHWIENIQDPKTGKYTDLYACDTCTVNSGYLGSLSEAINHMVAQQYRVKDDNWNTVVAKSQDTSKYARKLSKTWPRQNGRTEDNFLSRDRR